MSGRTGGRRPRDSLRSKPEATRGFIPSLTVYRDIIKRDHADSSAYDMQRGVIQAVRRLPKPLHDLYHVHDSGGLSMRVIEQHTVTKTFRRSESPPNSEDVENIAKSIHGGLTKLLSRGGVVLPFPIGEVKPFTPPRSSTKIVIFPMGWEGFRANYQAEDEEGRLTPLGTMLAERQLCIGAIALAVKNNNPAFKAKELELQPHITVASETRSVKTSNRNVVLSAIPDLIPDEVYLGPPVVAYRTGRRAEDVVELPVRPPSDAAI